MLWGGAGIQPVRQVSSIGEVVVECRILAYGKRSWYPLAIDEKETNPRIGPTFGVLVHLADGLAERLPQLLAVLTGRRSCLLV